MENKEKTVRKIANKVRKKYDLKFPADFDNVFKEKGIEITEKSLKRNEDGYSELKKDKLKIVINSDIEYMPRKRFTIAHELGHIFIGWHDDVTICQTDNEYSMHNMLDIQEKEANVFASELLMPTDWVKEKIERYMQQGIDILVNILCELAQTSVMAAFYALENAFSSGNVMIVYMGEATFGKKFVAEKTMEICLRETDFAESCEALSTVRKQYKIGTYQIEYFEFCKCPDKEKFQKRYHENHGNLLPTLMEFSGNNLLSLMHCIKSVLQYVSDKYILCLYKGQTLHLRILSEGVDTIVPYEITIKRLEDFCIQNAYYYVSMVIEKNYQIMIVKERVYQDPEYWNRTGTDSKILLNIILKEIYPGEEFKKKRMSISGIIGAANNRRNIESPQQMYDLLYKKMNRPELFEFTGHADYKKFLSVKAYELFQKRMQP